jgi:hypothetical protein
VYVNGETGQFWVIDYRLYDPDGDGQSKLDHLSDMLKGVVYSKQLPLSTVLMDSWYATEKLMAQIDQLEKLYYCPLKTNRRVDDSGGSTPYVRVSELVWHNAQLQQGKLIKIRGFPKGKKVKLFRVIVSTNAPGVCCHQRLISSFHRCCTRCVWYPLEDRGVSPRTEAAYGSRSLSVPQSSDSTKSHRLCLARLESPQNDRLSNRQNDLPDQAWDVVELLD